MTSRIPVASASPGHQRSNSSNPFIPFPDRAVSPNPSSQGGRNMSTLSGHALSEQRRKQSKRDEAIRKKIETELARKRTISTTHAGRPKRGHKLPAVRGTVAALRPSPALTVPDTITVADASQLCAAKRTDCVLVVDEEEGLSGIFTAKDLAYRVTAEGLDPRSTPVSVIMTRGPMVTRDTTSATEALELMVQRHFRHLPVCNEDGNVVGLLDITKVFHEALEKVERGSSASQKLYAALEGVQTELGTGMAANPQAAAMLAYVESLREKTALPDLTTIMDERTQPAICTPKSTVREAAQLMKDRRTTAVCVVEGSRVVGIFTSKDVVLRVIAAGLDPSRCSLVRVMTPHPDTAPPTMIIQDALKKMHNGHYLNLPVVEADGRLVAIVDVLKLTYATLEQMNAMSTESAGGDTSGGPMWGRFFESIGGHDDTESMVSGSNLPPDSALPPSYSQSPLKEVRASADSEVHPNDSASMVDDAPATADPMGAGSLTGVPVLAPVDDGTYVFKFRSPSGRTHRFQAREDNYENLRDIVAGKLAVDPFFATARASDAGEGPADPSDFHLSYTDADGDAVVISADGDVTDAVRIARKARQDRVVLYVQGGREWDTVQADREGAAKAAEVAAAVKEEEKVIEMVESALPEGVAMAPPAQVHTPVSDDLYGIPRDMVLPASIGALAVVIVGIFTVSRLLDR